MASNNVILLDYYGGDKNHSLSAWTSTFKELDVEIPDNISERVDVLFQYMRIYKKRHYSDLLNMLGTEGHHTPFEKSYLEFLVTAEQASHIHLLKHRIGVSINGESARYKELKEDKFYIPEDWKGIIIDSNAKDYIDGVTWDTKLVELTKLSNYYYHTAVKELTPKLGVKRAKESARFFKMFNSQISLDVSFNFRSFMHFMKLRNSDHAQKEIQYIAQQMLEQVQNIPGNPFEYSLKAFGY
jgi:flavin-dependent thymidylate synthase